MKVRCFSNVSSREVAATVLRSWLAKMWFPSPKLGVLITAAAVSLSAISALLAILIGQGVPFESSILLGIVLINTHVFSILIALLVSTSTAQESSTIAWWRVAPLTSRRLGRGLSILVWAAAIGQMILVVPTMLVLFNYQGRLKIALLTCLAIGTGTVMGRVVLVVSRVLCQRISMQSVNKAQVVATVIWLGYLSISFYATQQVLLTLVVEDRGLSWWAIIGYPLLFYVVADGTVITWIGVLLWIVAVVLIEVWLWPWAWIEKYGNDKVPTLGISYLARGLFPILRLELVRLLRQPKVRSAISSSYVIQAFFLVICWKFDLIVIMGESSMNILMFSGLLGAYCPVIARGISDRKAPYAMLVGLDPKKWAFLVNISSVILSLFITLPFLLAWAFLLGQQSQLYTGFVLAIFSALVAGIIGFILMPSADTGVMETFALFLVFLVMAAVIKVLQGFGLEDQEQLNFILPVISLFLIAIPCIVEQMRWNGGLDLKDGNITVKIRNL